MQKTEKLYNGKVYCVTVPSGKILVKRNKCTLVSGNSGDPVKIICGDAFGETEQERKGVIEILWDIFGGTVNAAGFKELDPHIGCIYGDSITLDRCKAICEGLKSKGFASTNIVLGIGSYTYQYNTRDTFGFALKSTYCVVNNEERLIYKDPATDSGLKKSQKGMVSVVSDAGGNLVCKDGLFSQDMTEESDNLMETVFENGKVTKHTSFMEIRETLSKS